MHSHDVIVFGGGVIGLSVALELKQLGREVLLLERSHCGDTVNGSATAASAGMLGVHDPRHPAALQPLAEFSYQVYPAYLDHLEQLSGTKIRPNTRDVLEAFLPSEFPEAKPLSETEVQSIEPQMRPGNAQWLLREEPCLDPRHLQAALLTACRAVGVDVRENEPVVQYTAEADGVQVHTRDNSFHAAQAVLATGAWTTLLTCNAIKTEPRRGQILVLKEPKDRPVRNAVRGLDCYLVPRGDGRLLVGSTVERAGFEVATQPHVIDRLHREAAELFPSLASAERMEQWAGLRPGTPDDLPIIGPTRQPGVFAATGHFRNGILLAPGTARVMGQIMQGHEPEIAIAAFDPRRFRVER